MPRKKKVPAHQDPQFIRRVKDEPNISLTKDGKLLLRTRIGGRSSKKTYPRPGDPSELSIAHLRQAVDDRDDIKHGRVVPEELVDLSLEDLVKMRLRDWDESVDVIFKTKTHIQYRSRIAPLAIFFGMPSDFATWIKDKKRLEGWDDLARQSHPKYRRGKMLVSRLTDSDVRAYIKWRQVTPMPGFTRTSKSAAVRELNILQATVSWAIEQGYKIRHVWKIPKGIPTSKRKKTPEVDDVLAVSRAFPEGSMWRAMWDLMAYCGLSPVDARKLRFSDIVVQKKMGLTFVERYRQKTDDMSQARQTTVVIPPPALVSLDAWLIHRPAVESEEDTIFLFRHTDGTYGPPHHYSLNDECKRAAARAGLTRHIPPGTLRKLFANILAEDRAHPHTLATALGHKSYKTQSYYTAGYIPYEALARSGEQVVQRLRDEVEGTWTAETDGVVDLFRRHEGQLQVLVSGRWWGQMPVEVRRAGEAAEPEEVSLE